MSATTSRCVAQDADDNTDNIDYDHLKVLIKHNTTAGTNRAVSIPGQGESTELAFRGDFLQVILEQHGRIILFVRSKSGEIERRLDHISKTLEQLQGRPQAGPPGAPLPMKAVERYARIDADLAKYVAVTQSCKSKTHMT